MIPSPTFIFESEFWKKGYEIVLGIDEVGRGAFAGPLVAAGVIFSPYQTVHEEIHDSKLLSPQKREVLASTIQKIAHWVTIVEVSHTHINKWGIGNAVALACQKIVKRAASDFPTVQICSIVDGYPQKGLPKNHLPFHKGIIKGDQKSFSIAAASILAKVYRDTRMRQYHIQYPKYYFFENKGYGTKIHTDAIKQFGLSNIHRKSFRLEKFL